MSDHQLVVADATLREVLAHHAAPAYVVASGTVVASSTSSTTFTSI